MINFKCLVILSVWVAVAVVTAAPREKRQADPSNTVTTFVCPRSQGQFEDKEDCSMFYRCDNGIPTLFECQPQLLFNPDKGYCDWPHSLKNASCVRRLRTVRPDGSMNSLCDVDPYGGKEEDSFIVAHPQFCNAFLTCGANYLYEPCTFCPEAMYFSQREGGCREIARGLNFTNFCQGKEYVEHKDKVNRQLDGSCWPFSDRPRPGNGTTARSEASSTTGHSTTAASFGQPTVTTTPVIPNRNSGILVQRSGYSFVFNNVSASFNMSSSEDSNSSPDISNVTMNITGHSRSYNENTVFTTSSADFLTNSTGNPSSESPL